MSEDAKPARAVMSPEEFYDRVMRAGLWGLTQLRDIVEVACRKRDYDTAIKALKEFLAAQVKLMKDFDAEAVERLKEAISEASGLASESVESRGRVRREVAEELAPAGGEVSGMQGGAERGAVGGKAEA